MWKRKTQELQLLNLFIFPAISYIYYCFFYTEHYLDAIHYFLKPWLILIHLNSPSNVQVKHKSLKNWSLFWNTTVRPNPLLKLLKHKYNFLNTIPRMFLFGIGYWTIIFKWAKIHIWSRYFHISNNQIMKITLATHLPHDNLILNWS